MPTKKREYIYWSLATRTVAMLLFLLILIQGKEALIVGFFTLSADASTENLVCTMACCRGRQQPNPNCCCRRSTSPSPMLAETHNEPESIADQPLTENQSDHCANLKKAASASNNRPVAAKSLKSDAVKINQKSYQTSPTAKATTNIAASELTRPCPCNDSLAPAYIGGLAPARTLARAVKPPPANSIKLHCYREPLKTTLRWFNQLSSRAPPLS